MKISKKRLTIVVILIIAALVWFQSGEGDHDELAKCLAKNGVKMYGASWCPHCKEQKTMFGSSWKYVPYVECASPSNPREQTAACKEADIKSYPTWRTREGRERTGSIELADLAQWSDCAIS